MIYDVTAPPNGHGIVCHGRHFSLLHNVIYWLHWWGNPCSSCPFAFIPTFWSVTMSPFIRFLPSPTFLNTKQLTMISTLAPGPWLHTR